MDENEWMKMNHRGVPAWGTSWGFIDGIIQEDAAKNDTRLIQYIQSKTPKDIFDGNKIYWDAQGKAIELSNQKSQTLKAFQASVSQQLSDKASRNRQIASITSVSIGIVALSWLIYLFLFLKKTNDAMPSGRSWTRT